VRCGKGRFGSLVFTEVFVCCYENLSVGLCICVFGSFCVNLAMLLPDGDYKIYRNVK